MILGIIQTKTSWLVNGFRNGFDMGYRGPLERINLSENLPLNVGSPVELWNKLMAEVRVSRVAGPFLNIPYDSYIQVTNRAGAKR